MLLKLEGFKYATLLDLNILYYHTQISEDASNLCTTLVATLSQIMAEKIKGPISHTHGWVNR